MSSLFHTSVAGGSQACEQNTPALEETRKEAAALIHTLFIELGRNLITPFDREDIHFLATGLNSVSRSMRHIAKLTKNYNIEHADQVTKIVTERIETVSHMLADVVRDLKEPGGLLRSASVCAEIKQVLHDCDDLLDQAIATTLEQTSDTVMLVKMIDHYEAMQRLLEKMGDTVDVCDSIIIKYS